MSKIIVTGGFGFIGSHLAETLVSKGYKVVVFDRYNNNNDYGWLNNSKYKKHIEFVLGDIRDLDSVYKCMKKAKAIFHLAALIGIPYSYESPLAYIKTNVEGTYNVLESAKLLSYKNVIITSTSETYGSAIYTPIDEQHRLLGQSPYSASKIAADQLSLSYYKSFNLPIKIVRPFNVYGPRQSTRAIIPTIINQIIKNPKKIYLGNTNTSRDYTYVSDTCDAFIKILNSKKVYGKILNVGTNTNNSIKKIFEIISKEMSKTPKLLLDKKRVRPLRSEVQDLLCDNSQLIQITGWKQKHSFLKGIKKTIKWYKKNKDIFNSKIYHV